MSLSPLTKPGRGRDGTPRLSSRAGDDGAVRGVLQTQLPHISEDGLHVVLGQQFLERTCIYIYIYLYVLYIMSIY